MCIYTSIYIILIYYHQKPIDLKEPIHYLWSNGYIRVDPSFLDLGTRWK
jgi:hypothetical protein